MMKLQHLRKQCFLAEKLRRIVSFNVIKVTITVQFSANYEKSVNYAKMKKYIKLTILFGHLRLSRYLFENEDQSFFH